MRVIELHSPVKLVQRSQGRTATAAAAYRSATRIKCERTGETHDYRRKKGVEQTAVLVPADAPEWALDRSQLWNAAELREKHPRAQTARDLEVSFPAEFNAEQRREAGLAIGQMLAERYGVAADLCWHKPGRKSDERNHHLHVLFTTRRFENGEWAKTKDRTLDDLFGKGKEEILSLRQGVAGVLNDIAARDRLDVYVEHLSFEKRGLDQEATQHLGPAAAEMERNGLKTDIGEKNRTIAALNTERKKLREQYKVVAQAIAQAEKQPKTRQPAPLGDDLTAFYQDTQARRRALLERLEAEHGRQEKAARQALEQMSGALNENIIGQWRKLAGKTEAERELIARHRATLEAIQQQRQAAFAAFERDRQARLTKLTNPVQQSEPVKDERQTRAQQITAIYRTADNAQALQAALAEAGYTLAQGKRVVVIDRNFKTYSLARLVEGAREKEIRTRLNGLELPGADETLKRLAAERAKQPDPQAQETELMKPNQAEKAAAGPGQQQEEKQQHGDDAPAPGKRRAPVVWADFLDRQQSELARQARERDEARQRLENLFEQQYGQRERQLRAEAEKLDKALHGASPIKRRMLKARGVIPQDAEEKLAKLRAEQARIEAQRRAAFELMEKAQRENEEAIRRRQEEERADLRGRARPPAPEFNTVSQAPKETPPAAPQAKRTITPSMHARLQRQQLDELLKFDDEAATERNRVIRRLELQYKMTDRDRQIAAAYGHARQEELFEAHKKEALDRLEKSLKEREQAIKTAHERQRQELQNGVAQPRTPLAQKFERANPAPEPPSPARKQRADVQTQQPAPAVPAAVQQTAQEQRPASAERSVPRERQTPEPTKAHAPKSSKPLPEHHAANDNFPRWHPNNIDFHLELQIREYGELNHLDAYADDDEGDWDVEAPKAEVSQQEIAQANDNRRRAPQALNRDTPEQAAPRDQSAPAVNIEAQSSATEEDEARYELLDRWSRQQNQQAQRETERQAGQGEAGHADGALTPEDEARYALLDQWAGAQERGLDRSPTLEP